MDTSPGPSCPMIIDPRIHKAAPPESPEDSCDSSDENDNLQADDVMKPPLPLPPESENASIIFPICRICHQPGEEHEILISPCRCAGSLQYIHNNCLMRWLEVSMRKSRKPPRCELCHFQYHRHKKFKFNHWRLPKISKRDKVLHAIFLINLLIMISCAIATVMCFLSDKGRITKFPRNKVDLTPEEIITLSCGVLFFLSFFIAMTVQIKARHTIYQLFVKFIMQNMEWEIDEYDKTKDDLFKQDTNPIHSIVFV
ncbi:E3 ubiquitin-protein ligase MARCHF4-like isoform X2 [Lineus longissimus]